MLSIIVAISDNYAIGRGGDMPWHISEDLKYFKRTTVGHTVIMGRRTWESIGCRPLPNRRHIVVSRTMAPAEGVIVVSTIKKALRLAGRKEAFVMGGGQLYAAAMPLANRLYITRVHTVIEDADTFFPEIDLQQWQLASRSETYTDPGSGLEFEFEVYDRKAQ